MPQFIDFNDFEFNPFAFLFDPNEEILATLYRKSLDDKYLDTLSVLTGCGYNILWHPDIFNAKHYMRPWDEKPHLGLYDYFTLGITMLIPLLGFIAAHFYEKYQNEVSAENRKADWRNLFYVGVLIIFCYVIGFPIMAIDWTLRFIVGFIGLFIATPLIIGLHLYVNYHFREVTSTIYEMQVVGKIRYLNDQNYYIYNLEGRIGFDGPMNAKSQLIEQTGSPTPHEFVIAFESQRYNRYIDTDLLNQKNNLIIIPTPEYARHLKQLAKINFAGIGNLIKQNQALQHYINDVEAGRPHGFKQARDSLFLCLLLLRKFPADFVRTITSYLIPNHTIYTDMSVSGFKTNILSAHSFFTKANRIFDKAFKKEAPVTPPIIDQTEEAENLDNTAIAFMVK